MKKSNIPLKNKFKEDFIAREKNLIIQLQQILTGDLSNFKGGIHQFLNFRSKELSKIISQDIIPSLAEDIHYWNRKLSFQKYQIDEEEIIEQIIGDLINFFERYYNHGRFIPQKLNLAVKSQEDTRLWWATEDQYYVKPRDHQIRYQFSSHHIQVEFICNQALERMQESKQKGIHQPYFLLKDSTWDKNSSNLKFQFEYRPLSSEEYHSLKKKRKLTRVSSIHIFQDNLEQIQHFISNHQELITQNLLDPYKPLLSEEYAQKMQKSANQSNQKTKIKKVKKKAKMISAIEWHFRQLCQYKGEEYLIHRDLRSFFIQELEKFIKDVHFSSFPSFRSLSSSYMDIFSNNFTNDLPNERTDERTNEFGDEIINNSPIKFMDKFNDNLIDLLADKSAVDLTDELAARMMKIRIRSYFITKFSLQLINHLANFEEILREIWEKPKLVLKTDYCLTLDLIPTHFIPEILLNKKQTEWWKEHLDFNLLQMIKNKHLFGQSLSLKEFSSFIPIKDHKTNEISHVLKFSENFKRSFPNLMIDTKFFPKKFRNQIIASISNFDEKTTGILFQSDNYQALRILLHKYRNNIDLCYIDPPYNTGNTTFSYHDGFLHSYWLSLMQSSLTELYPLFSERGLLITSLDDHETHYFRLLSNQVFGEHNFIADILWHSTKSMTNTALISQAHTHNIIFSKNISYYRSHRNEFRLPESGEGFTNPDNDPKGPWKADPFQVGGWRPNQQYVIKNPKTGKEYYPNPGCSWKNDYNTFQKLLNEGRIVFGKSGEAGPQRKRYQFEAMNRGRVTNTLWTDLPTTTKATTDLKQMFGTIVFSNPKPTALIKRFIELGSAENSWILDFFAGSGTTGQAVLELNQSSKSHRKFILIEKSSYFESVLKPRLLKFVFSPKWRAGKPKLIDLNSVDSKSNSVAKRHIDTAEESKQKSIIIKYHILEQFEDTFENISFSNQNLLNPNDFIHNYPYMLSNLPVPNPFRSIYNIQSDTGIKSVNVDLIETFNYLYSIQIDSYQWHEHHGVEYLFILGIKTEKRILIIWYNKTDSIDLNQEKAFLKKNIANYTYTEVFINGQKINLDSFFL
ncbi:MAG: site-specific DNA-methyltransferase [Candidatus Lokiarchaeota archaeon]|nr:site-specific DNA-methyltransferase [Candidatus Harpocratesius repetitus]